MPGVQYFALITGLGFAFEGKGVKGKVLCALVSLLYKIALLRANKVVFQNHDDLNYMLKHRIVDAKKCSVISGSGVNSAQFAFRSLPTAGAIRFTMISRLLKEKGVFYFVEAAKVVIQKYPDAEFHLIGPLDSSPSAISKHEVEGWVASGHIIYHGACNDVRPYLDTCHVFVLPSYYGEGLPRTLLEAMSVGRPLLTTDNVGCREVVENGQNGFIVPIRDSDALVEKMLWFIEHPDRLAKMGHLSRRMVMERFEVDIINQQFFQVLGVDDVKTQL
jgi:glycosyltransferase involved in cell wall biosynthesis